MRSEAFQSLIKAQPRLLVHEGRLLTRATRCERVTREEVLAALRAQGFGSIDEIDSVVLETDGSLSVLEKIRPGASLPMGVNLGAEKSQQTR